MFAQGFEKIAKARWAKELAKNPKLFKGHGLTDSPRRYFTSADTTMKPMSEIKHLYRKKPGLGTLAPFRGKDAHPDNIHRVIGHEKGNIKLYHGTTNRSGVLTSGLSPSNKRMSYALEGAHRKGVTHLTESKDVAESYSKQIPFGSKRDFKTKHGYTPRSGVVEAEIPKKHIKYYRPSGSSEYITDKPVLSKHLKDVTEK